MVYNKHGKEDILDPLKNTSRPMALATIWRLLKFKKSALQKIIYKVPQRDKKHTVTHTIYVSNLAELNRASQFNWGKNLDHCLILKNLLYSQNEKGSMTAHVNKTLTSHN